MDFKGLVTIVNQNDGDVRVKMVIDNGNKTMQFVIVQELKINRVEIQVVSMPF